MRDQPPEAAVSHDLFFQSRSGPKLDKKSFAAYFNGRRNYTVSKAQAVYENEDTGVAFIFDAPEDGMVAFNLNYFRPHTFGLEAAIELESFTKSLSLVVIDPQADGEPETFTTPKFLKAWNDGNRFGYRAMLSETTDPVHSWPSKRIRQVWDWNYNRHALQQKLGEDIFVPGIFAADIDGQPLSVIVWPPECSIVLPTVDALLVPCEQRGKLSEEVALVKWSQISSWLGPFQEKAEGLPRYRLDFDKWPKELKAFLETRRPPADQLNGIALSDVLDSELVAEASA
jgi:hypothetical protein